MKKSKNHIDIHTHLTKNELVDYTNGVLGYEEMYRLELHLNECELCSDAIEGVELLTNSNVVLDEITADILPTQNKTIAPNYLTIAASIALFAVAGLSYWLISKPSNIEPVAINTPEDQVEKKQPSISIESPIIIEETELDDSLNNVTLNLRPQEESESVSTRVSKNTVITSTTPQKSTIRAKNIESVESDVAQVNTFNDSEQNKQDIAKEEMANGVLDSEVSQVETVVPEPTTSRAEKKSRTSEPILKNQKEPTPTTGMTGLKSYIDKNIQYPPQAMDNNIKGTVVLEVSINSDGSINNLTIIKGLGYGCDAEAMRLISTGPKWTPKVENGKAVKANKQVKIKFKKR